MRPTGKKGKGLSAAALVEMKKLAEHGNRTGERKRVHKRYTNARGDVRMVGHDFIGVFTIADDALSADTIVSFNLNPTELPFEALQIQSQLHQQFTFDDFAVHMPNTASDFVNGDALGWYDRDPNEAVPAGVSGIQLGYFKQGVSGAYKAGHVWQQPKFPNLPELYCQSNFSDDRFTVQSIFNLQVITPPSTYISGSATPVELLVELWAAYSCHFKVPNLAPNFSQGGPSARFFSASPSVGPTVDDPLQCSDNTMALATTGQPGGQFNWVEDDFTGLALDVDSKGYSRISLLKGYGHDHVPGIKVIFSVNGTEAIVYGASTFTDAYNCAVADGGWYQNSSTASATWLNVALLTLDPPAPLTLNQPWVITRPGFLERFVTGPYPVIAAFSMHVASTIGSWGPSGAFCLQATGFNHGDVKSSLYYAGRATIEGQCLAKWREMDPSKRGTAAAFVREYLARRKKKRPDAYNPKLFITETKTSLPPETLSIKSASSSFPLQSPPARAGDRPGLRLAPIVDLEDMVVEKPDEKESKWTVLRQRPGPAK